MLLCLVKGSRDFLLVSFPVFAGEWRSGRLLGADKIGKGRSGWEGKLLGGHVHQIGWVRGRPADR
jgi:hypothetical protein